MIGDERERERRKILGVLKSMKDKLHMEEEKLMENREEEEEKSEKGEGLA